MKDISMRIHLIAGARKFERASAPLKRAWRGQAVANLTLPTLAALIPARHQVSIQDEQAAPVDLQAPMDLALLTAKTCYAPRAYQMASVLRGRGVPVVMGGCHASLNPEEVLGHCDAVAVGEAETIMPKLLADAQAGSLESVYQGQPASLQLQPRPRRELLQKNFLVDAVVVSRGCNYACSFCCIRNLYGKGFRARPVAEVVDEIKKLGPTIGFLDENLVGNRDWAAELFAALQPLGRRWLAQVSADIIEQPELIFQAARAGALGFQFGLETVNPQNLKAVGKNHNKVEKYRELIDTCHEAGILTAAGILFGFEGDTVDTFAETLAALREMKVDLCYFKIATAYPGTKFFQKMEAEKRILTRDWRYYDGYFPTYRPKQLTPRQLFDGVQWVADEFYSPAAVAARIPRYLKLRIPLWASLNMNRITKRAFDHTHQLGDSFLEDFCA